MKKYTILTLVALLTGTQRVAHAMDAPTQVPKGNRPPIGTHTQAQAWKKTLRNMIMQLPQKTSKPMPHGFMQKYNPQLKDISAFIQATLLDPGAENARLIYEKGVAVPLFNLAHQLNHPATMMWLAQNQKSVRQFAQIQFDWTLPDTKYDQAEFWLKYGADINKQNESGETALLKYTRDGSLSGNEKRIQWLLEHGADPNLQSTSGYTPLHYAIMIGDAPIAKLLLDRGAKVDIKNNDGNTAQDIYLKLSSRERQKLDNTGITQRLGIQDK